MKLLWPASLLLCMFLGIPLAANAQLTSPGIGWQAELVERFHDVTGTVTIVDEDTIRVDDFTYDGGGPAVYFYLGADESSFGSGVPIGSLLTGTVYDGTQEPLFFDLMQGEGSTLEGWNAISVWCVDFSVNFGSGTFVAPVPTSADFNGDGHVDAADYAVWRNNTSGQYTQADYQLWRSQYGQSTTGPTTSSAPHASAPEPTALLLACLGLVLGCSARKTGQLA